MSTKFLNTDETQTTINYFRSCKLFRGKNISGKNLRKLFIGLAVEIARAEGKLQEISDQYNPCNTTLLIREWEKALGIPDDCIPIASTNAQRLDWICIKLSALGVSTKEDFEDLGTILGFDIEVYSGKDTQTFPYIFPFMLINEDARWVMIVKGDSSIAPSVFTYTFPLTFGEDRTAILRCLFQKLVPANVKVYFNFS